MAASYCRNLPWRRSLRTSQWGELPHVKHNVTAVKHGDQISLKRLMIVSTGFRGFQRIVGRVRDNWAARWSQVVLLMMSHPKVLHRFGRPPKSWIAALSTRCPEGVWSYGECGFPVYEWFAKLVLMMSAVGSIRLPLNFGDASSFCPRSGAVTSSVMVNRPRRVPIVVSEQVYRELRQG